MYEISVAILFITTCIGLVRGYAISPDSNLLLNQNRLAVDRLDWKTPAPAKDDQAIVLTFDDIPTSDGQSPIGSYNGLHFTGLTAVNVSTSSLLDDEDIDCATSHPSTLFSSSYPDNGQLPQIKISNSSLVFDLLSLSIKPRLKRYSDPTVIRYRFWQVRAGKTEAMELHQVLHGVGHHAVTHVDFEKYGYTIERLAAIEFAVIEEGITDHALCLDDLGVRIRKLADSKASD